VSGLRTVFNTLASISKQEHSLVYKYRYLYCLFNNSVRSVRELLFNLIGIKAHMLKNSRVQLMVKFPYKIYCNRLRERDSLCPISNTIKLCARALSLTLYSISNNTVCPYLTTYLLVLSNNICCAPGREGVSL